jgi:DNA-binding transcriptional LysR family regulator
MILDPNRLRLLRELEHRGTIGAVAEALDYTPSAVSQQLTRLQQEVGVQLLERVGRGVRLTEAAHTLVRHAEVLAQQLDRAQADLEAAAGEVRGLVRISTFQTPGMRLLPPALAALAVEHPTLDVEVVEREAIEAQPELVLGRLDLTIVDQFPGHPYPRHRAIDYELLMEDPLLIALPPDDPLAASGGPVALADLRGHPWGAGKPETIYGDGTTRLCNELAGFEPRIRHRANDMDILLGLVRVGRAVVFTPALLGGEEELGVAVRPVAEGPIARKLYTAVRQATAERPALQAVRGALRDAATRIAAGAAPAPGSPRAP